MRLINNTQLVELLNSYGTNISQISKGINVTYGGLWNSFNNNTLNVKTLCKIVELTNIPVESFFTADEQ